MFSESTKAHLRYDADTGTLYLLTGPDSILHTILLLLPIPVSILAFGLDYAQYKGLEPYGWGIVVGLIALFLFFCALFFRKEYAFRKNTDTFSSVYCFPAFVKRWNCTLSFGKREYTLYRESYVEIAKRHERNRYVVRTWYPVILHLERGHAHEIFSFSEWFEEPGEADHFAQLIANQLHLEVRKTFEQTDQ